MTNERRQPPPSPGTDPLPSPPSNSEASAASSSPASPPSPRHSLSSSPRRGGAKPTTPSAGGFDQVGASGMLNGWARTTFASLAVRNYRYFFLGQGISLVGTWMRRTALGWLVYQITGSRALLGVVMGLALLPLFLLSPTAGAIADRVDKRRMILGSQVLATLVSAAIAVLVFFEWVEVWHLMVLAFLGGVAFAFEVPARQAFIVEMVGRDNLMNAIALNSVLINLSRIAGPVLAGVIMATAGMAFCFALDAVSYLFVIGTLLALRLPPFVKPESKGSHWGQLLDGWRELRRNRRVRFVLGLLFFVGVFGWSFQTLMPAIAQDYLKVTEMEYGVLMSLFGVGAIAGALYVAGRKSSRRRMPLFVGVWTMTGGVMLVALSRSFAPTAAALALAGFGAVLFISVGNTIVQTGVADSIRGRIMGMWALAFGGSLPIGSFLAGGVAEFLSPYTTILLFSLVLTGASLVFFFRLQGAELETDADDF